MAIFESERLRWIDYRDVISLLRLIVLWGNVGIAVPLRWYNRFAEQVNVVRLVALQLFKVARHTDVIQGSLEVVCYDLLRGAMLLVEVID